MTDERCDAVVHGAEARGPIAMRHCARKATHGTKCKQHAGVVSATALAPAFYACPELDEKGHDCIVIEEIRVRWENEQEVMLERQPRGLFAQKLRKEHVPRTREAAMARFIEQQKSKLENAMRAIAQCERMLAIAKDHESQMDKTGKTEFLREKKP